MGVGHSGKLELPAGKRDQKKDSANPKLTAIRETIEELGIDVNTKRLESILDYMPMHVEPNIKEGKPANSVPDTSACTSCP